MMNADRTKWQRRALLAGGLLATVAWVKGVPYLGSLGAVDLEFETLPNMAPFRWLITNGSITSGAALFAGMEVREPLTAEQTLLIQSVKLDPCKAIYGSEGDGRVPLAMFSDFACPNCRIMDSRIKELEVNDPDSFRMVRHQLPILGAASTTASRAVLAAERQGAYREMHERLIRTPAVTDATYVAAVAANIGLDPSQFMVDLKSEEITQALRLTEAIARVFGFYGTPAFAVGRTVFLGAIPTSTLRALIANEVENPC